MAKTLHFSNRALYNKWLAYGHMHIPNFGKTPQKIEIAGKPHKVVHSKKKK